jgi:hypothetical protein
MAVNIDFRVKNGLAVATTATIEGTTQSISTNTGALQVYGGVGIGGNLYIGGTTNIGGITTSTNTTDASSTATGALQVYGGVGIGGRLYVGNDIYSRGNLVVTAGNIGTYGVSSISTGSGISVNTSTGAVTITSTDTLQTVTSRGATTNQAITLSNTGASTVTNTANALYVQGGVWIDKTLNILGNLTGTTATITQVYGNSGQFFGDISGFGALYAGISTGFSVLPSTVFQTTARINDYAQNNFQNLNNGITASTDWVATSANGNDVTNYIDLGITSGTWDGTQSNSLGTALGQNDGYLYVQGSGTNYVGNLVIGARNTGSQLKIVVGGFGLSAVTAYFNSATTQSISTNTGAFTVRGGIGISGNIYVGNSATIASTMASTTTVASNALYVVGGVGVKGSLYVTGPAVFQDNVTFNGTSTYVFSTNTVYTDNIIELHYPVTPGNVWTVDDKKDIGLRFHYYDTQDNNAFLGRDDATGYLEWISSGVEDSTSTVSGTFGIFKTGGIILANTTASNSTSTGALTVAGGVGIGGDLRVGGTIFGVASVTGIITTATNVAGGTAGQLHYQTGPGATSFAGPGNSGQLLMSSGTSAPLYVNTASVVIGNAANIAAGTAGQLVYQSSTGTTAFVSTGTVGQLLMSSGTSAPLYVNTASVVIGNAANIAGGTAGQIHYQSSTGTTAFVSTGTVGQLLMSSGTSAPLYVNTASVVIGNAANIAAGTAGQLVYQSSTGTTGFVSTGSVGQLLMSSGTSAPLYVNTASIVVGNAANIAGGTAGLIPIQSGVGTTAFINTGTVGYLLQMQLGNTATWVSTGSLVTAYANTATNIAGGTAGQLVYQSNVGSTSFAGPGNSGQLLMSSGTSAPLYVNTASVVIGNAANIAGGTAGQIHYQSSTGTTAFVSTGSVGQLLMSSGTSAPLYVNTASVVIGNAANIAAGTAGQLVYQSSTGTTAFVSTGSVGTVLVSNGTAAPTYSNTLTLSGVTSSISTNSGALQVVGGVGIGGALYVGGTIFGTVSGTITTATNIGAGYAGLIPIQSNTGTTSFINTGSVGNLLQYQSGSTATFVSTATLQVGYSVTATNVAGGTAGQLHYQSAIGATSFVSTGTSGNVLVSNGTGAPTFNNTLTLASTTTSISTTTGALQVRGGVGVADSIYVGNRVGFVNTSNVSVVYQYYNAATNSLDTVFG